MRDLAFAFVWLTLLPLCVMSAYVGVLLWVWVALLSPNELLYGFMSGVPFNKAVAVATLLLVALGREKKDFYADKITVLLLGFALVATASWLGSIVPSADGTDLYEKLLKDIVLAIVIMAAMTTRHRIDLLVLVICVSLGFLSTKEGLIAILTAGGHKIIGSGSVGDNNSLATALLMVMPLNFYLIRQSAVRGVRLVLLAVLVLSVVTVIMTFSRGGFIGLLVLAMFVLKNSRNKLGTGALLICCGVLIYGLAPAAWFDRLNTIQTADNDGSFMGRVVAWKMSWLIAMDHPLFGGGLHAVQRMLVWDTYRPFLYKLDFISTPPADTVPHAAHSIYFEVLGDLGFAGLALFVSLLLATLWTCRAIAKIARTDPRLTWAADLSRMMQISIVVYATSAAALSMGYFELVYIMVALTSRVYRTVKQERDAYSVETSIVEADPLPVVPHHRQLAGFHA